MAWASNGEFSEAVKQLSQQLLIREDQYSSVESFQRWGPEGQWLVMANKEVDSSPGLSQVALERSPGDGTFGVVKHDYDFPLLQKLRLWLSPCGKVKVGNLFHHSKQQLNGEI